MHHASFCIWLLSLNLTPGRQKAVFKRMRALASCCRRRRGRRLSPVALCTCLGRMQTMDASSWYWSHWAHCLTHSLSLSCEYECERELTQRACTRKLFQLHRAMWQRMADKLEHQRQRNSLVAIVHLLLLLLAGCCCCGYHWCFVLRDLVSPCHPLAGSLLRLSSLLCALCAYWNSRRRRVALW